MSLFKAKANELKVFGPGAKEAFDEKPRGKAKLSMTVERKMKRPKLRARAEQSQDRVRSSGRVEKVT